MGLWHSAPADEGPPLQRLQRLCSLGQEEDPKAKSPAEALGKGVWALPKRMQELAKLGTRDDFVRSGGVCAAVTLMLAQPADREVHHFALRLVLSVALTPEQVALLWRPALAALARFAADSAVQEPAALLCLHACVWPPLAAEAEPALPLLHAAADKVLAAGLTGHGSAEDQAAREQMKAGESAAAQVCSPGLCAELLAAVRARGGTANPELVGLWHKGLGIAARRLLPQDAVPLLQLIRDTVQDSRAPSAWVLTSLATLRHLYHTGQLDAFDEDAGMLCRVLQEASKSEDVDDIPVTVAALGALGAMSRAPSVPAHPSAFLSVVRDIVASKPCEAVGDAACSMLREWIDAAPAPLADCAQAAVVCIGELLAVPSLEVVGDAAQLAHRLITDPARRSIVQAHGTSALVTSCAAVEPRYFAPLVPLIAKWAQKGLLSPEDAAVVGCSLCAYCSDAARAASLSADSAVSQVAAPGVCAALEVVAAWAADPATRGFVAPQLPLAVKTAGQLIGRYAPLYDRPAARLIAEAVYPISGSAAPAPAAGSEPAAAAEAAAPRREVVASLATPEAWEAVIAVFGREQTYWLPDRELLSRLHALGVAGGMLDGTGDAAIAVLPDEFRRTAEAFRTSTAGRRLGARAQSITLQFLTPTPEQAAYHLQPSRAQALYNWMWGSR
eukprot:TRINITY_DN70548_c0_g1_i1.p1 TRINITY_DN70548_c0_g1~~TRINITY_DN70548_c0_g1_i1.p1  ORF type:complete len:706 (+),score=243.29 TRINITY_DN70548_c0_g1_i1:105-2120(+)